MKNFTPLKASVAPLVLGLAMISAPAYAEEVQSQDSEDSTSAESGNDSGLIVVTGSRILRSELVGTEPTTSIGEDYYKDRNIENVADALNELPQFRNSTTPSGAQGSFGNGVNFVNTFGLGSNRTLTLVNGNRVVTSNVPSLFGSANPGTQVDLNSIPAILIRRIDTVSVGGAPVYGSDAIAGTVNIMLDSKYNGLTLRATTGMTERGDGFRYSISGKAGQDFADGRGNVTISAQYDKLDGLRGIDRQQVRDNIGFLPNANCPGGPGTLPAAGDGRLNPNIACDNRLGTTTPDGLPGNVAFFNVASPFLSPTGVIRGVGGPSMQFAPDGSVEAIVPINNISGFFGTTGANATPNTYITSDQTQITSDLKRFSTWLFASYELFPEAELYFEGTYYNAQARELGNSPAFNTFAFGPSSVSGGLTFDVATNPFLTTAARNYFNGLGATTFNVSRSNEDLIDQSALSETELKRAVVGVRGDFEALGRSLNYNVSFNYGETEIENLSENINQQNFINAVTFTTDANGNAVCTLTPAVAVAPGQPKQPIADPNCVPLNLFGFGQASAAALDYITEDTVDRSKLRQWVFNANVGGDLFDTWAGPVGFNIGYEHRDEKGAFLVSEFAKAGRGRSATLADLSGQYNLDEVFGEVFVPLVSPDNNIPFLNKVEVFARGRYVDNSLTGGFTSWAVGGQVAPIEDITFRGNFTRSFRAPAITELFLPASPTFVSPPDLCQVSAIGGGPVPATRTANCTAFLTATGNNPATYRLLASQASVSGLSGGNVNLQNEQADSYTFGAILQPRFVPGLTVTVDYVDIELTGPIANLTVTQIMQGCFDNTNFNAADPINGNGFCTQLGFDATGQIPNTPTNPAVQTGFVNGQQYLFNGITGALDYNTSLDGLGIPGRINVGGNLMYVRRRLIDNTGVAPQRSDGSFVTATFKDPEWTGQARIRYSDDNWGLGTHINYTGKLLTSRQNRGPNPNNTREFDHYNAFVTVDANIFFRTEDGFRLNVSVTNLFDRIGQNYFGFIPNGSVNDFFGRRYAVSVTKEF